MPPTNVLLPPGRLRHVTSKAAPLTKTQRKERAEHNRVRQEEINDAVAEWKQTMLKTASDLAEQFGKKPHHFLDLFFQNGAHLVHKCSKVNAHNAFLHMKAEELCENGEIPTLARLNEEEVRSEYDNLNHNEREEIIVRHAESSSAACQQRVTAKARVQDVANTFKTMQQIMNGLNTRVGVEGFICLVRNSPDFHMDPKWYFSNPAFMEYMKIAVPAHKGWDIGHVGAKLEVFAIAGCDTIRLHRTSKQRADEMKRQIRDKIHTMLTEITGNENAQMHYIDYEEKIVQRFGVELVGWTYDKLVNLSLLSTSLPGLRKLLDAFNNGTCKFVHLTPLQLNEHSQEHQIAIDDGSVPAPKTRKSWKDRGTKRKEVDELDKENEN
ncbi:hypothetical protein CVT25_013034, partial [Psilocybe cyanescens]